MALAPERPAGRIIAVHAHRAHALVGGVARAGACFFKIYPLFFGFSQLRHWMRPLLPPVFPTHVNDGSCGVACGVVVAAQTLC